MEEGLDKTALEKQSRQCRQAGRPEVSHNRGVSTVNKLAAYGFDINKCPAPGGRGKEISNKPQKQRGKPEAKNTETLGIATVGLRTGCVCTRNKGVTKRVRALRITKSGNGLLYADVAKKKPAATHANKTQWTQSTTGRPEVHNNLQSVPSRGRGGKGPGNTLKARAKPLRGKACQNWGGGGG